MLCEYVTCRHLLNENMVWLVISVLMYLVWPYPVALGVTPGWAARRLLLNVSLMLAFFGFFHAACYRWGWTSRPFQAIRGYSVPRVLHNVFYSLVGTIMWTLFEILYVFALSSGRLDFIPDTQIFARGNLHLLFFAVALPPVFRDVHFYLIHRFIHTGFMYQFVHSLHHRNIDIEPFSGICMHVVEHLYYFGCALLPCVYMRISPFSFLWCGIHALLSPAGSHSGFEDHWQGDLYHYLHHRYFDVNFGSLGIPFDVWFGTYRMSLGKLKPSKDAKARLTAPTPQSAVYLMTVLLMFATFGATVAGVIRVPYSPVIVAFGPVAAALMMRLATFNTNTSVCLAKHLLAPFHKFTASEVMHLISTVLICVLPVYHFAQILV